MKRGRKATTSTAATNPAALSASPLDTAHRRSTEQAGGPDEEDGEDHRHLFRVEEDARRDHHPGPRAERRREAPAEREHPPHAHADEPALLGVHGCRPQAEPELREAEEERQQRDRGAANAAAAEDLDREA